MAEQVTPVPSRWFSRVYVLFPLCFLSAGALFAQRPTPSGRGPAPSLMESPVTVVVSVRETNGMPLPGNAFVKLYSNFSGVHLTAPTQDGSNATFPSIQGGEYEIEVSSTGYKTASEHASVMGGGSNFLVFIYLHPESEVAPTNSSGGPPIVTPKLQAEIDKGMENLRREKYQAAREHLEKAAKMAPANPDVQYLLGLLEYRQQNMDAAQAKFQNALAIYPSHERALVALGELLMRAGKPADAAESLQKAYQINGADWRTLVLLAGAYAVQKDYDKAAPHAVRAADLAKAASPAPRLLLGRIRAAQGKQVDARQAFNAVIHDFPADPAASEAKRELAALDAPPATLVSAITRPYSAASSSAAPSNPLPALPLVVRPWAPPDIDAKEYPVLQDVSCSLDEVMARAQHRTATQLGNYEKFVATERVEHQEVDANGVAGPARSHDFNYLVFVRRPQKGYVFLEETRDGGENLDAFPTALASKGLVALGVYIFDPQYEPDLNYRCEGLGQWRGQPAWEIRFQQRKEVPSRIRSWRNTRGTFAIPLKGRVWLSANSYDVLHIETDLREPQREIELNRDHLVIDYGPVQFEHGKTRLWLPWHAELFMELHGKRYHHRHTLTNYALFSVDTTHALSAPESKQTDEP